MIRVVVMCWVVAVMATGAAGAALAMGPATQQGGTAAERRVAMVIGNGAYAHAAPLENPANDARDISAALKAAGFEVFEAIDQSKSALERTLRDFARNIEGADVALLFYAGHGLQVGGRNYLIPIDARLASERDLDFEAIRVEFILAQMELGREGKTTLVFLDACRDNPLARNLARSMGTRSAALGRGLAEVKSGVGTFVSFSTQPGNVAVDGDGRNSPFTAALKRHIGARGLSLNATMIRVRRDVIKATGGRQVPWDHSALTGEFFFHPASAPARGGAGEAGNQAGNAQTGIDVAAMARRLKELEAAIQKREQAAQQGTASRRADLNYQLRNLERAQRADQSKIFEMNRASIGASARERLNIGRERHQLSIAMIERSKEIKRLRGELTALAEAETRTQTPAAKAASAPAAQSDKREAAQCASVPRALRNPIKLSTGLRLCSAVNGDFAKVLRIANRAVVFSVNDGQEFTCRAGETCQFNWRSSPYFTIRARADTARGIPPSGELVPR